jgi:carotenoid cleavage dioxygenase-like enzyme
MEIVPLTPFAFITAMQILSNDMSELKSVLLNGRLGGAVFGLYRNRYTDDFGVRHLVHSRRNTHVVYYNKMLLALKEDSPPYALDPDTLETLGTFLLTKLTWRLYTFGGQLRSRTSTAHPKFDPDIGEMITIGYEAKGDGPNDVCYMRFDKHGKKIDECFMKTPMPEWCMVLSPQSH